MNYSADYFKLARAEEAAGQPVPALLHYLSSFCAGFYPGVAYPYQATAKIRHLQLRLGLTDEQLFSYVHSYGALTDMECRQLLYFSICGQLSGIQSVLAGSSSANGGFL